MCVTALANLTWRKKQKGQGRNPAFSLQEDIIPFIDQNWIWLTSMPRRVKLTWHQTLQKTLLKESDLFFSSDISINDDEDPRFFGLLEPDLGHIGPHNELIRAVGRRPPTQQSGVVPQTSGVTPDALQGGTVGEDLDGPKTRGAKRKAESQASAGVAKRNKGNDSTFTKFSGYAIPVEHPFNRDGYRYFLAEPDCHAPNRLEFDEKEETAGKPIPAYMYRIVRPSLVELSSHDRAPQLKLADDHLTVTGEKGYAVVRGSHAVNRGAWFFELAFIDQPQASHTRIGWARALGAAKAGRRPPNCDREKGYAVVRGSHAVNRGAWFFEVAFIDQPLASHTRIGWARALGCLQAPVGYDRFSYCWRSRKGTRFHNSVGKHYCTGGYQAGDTLGCYIELPDNIDRRPVLPATHKDMPLIKFKNHFYYEEKDEVQKAVKTLTPNIGSRIAFFRNGTNKGTAFTDVYAGSYYPAISLYKNATVRVNFGPKFRYPPKNLKFRPMSERAEELLVEQCLADCLYLVCNEGNLTLDV